MKFNTISIITLILILTVKPLQAQEHLIFSTFPADNPIVKICQAVMKTAYQKMGIELKVRHYPPARGIQLANEGQTDGELYRSIRINGKFSNLVMIPVPITYTQIVVFTKNVRFPITNWDSLIPYKIGIERGFKLVEAKTREMNTQSAKVEETFKMLDAGRVDIVVSTKLGGTSFLKGLQLTGITILNPPLEKDVIHHFIHKKHWNLVPKLTEILENMNKSGEIEKIQKQVESNLFN